MDHFAGQNDNINPVPGREDEVFDRALRPSGFDEYVGQSRLTDNLKVFVTAARQRNEPLDHVLFCGPPGLGKTTLAHIMSKEMDAPITCVQAPALERKADLAGILTNLREKEVLFIDEIHRLNPAVEECLYAAMEDFHFDVVFGEGPRARSIRLPLKPFTLVGATTRTGLLTGPLRDRFGVTGRLEYYADSDLASIIERSAKILNIQIHPDASVEIARRSRGTPRIANRLLRRVRDFAEVEGNGSIDKEMASSSLGRLDVDNMGLDRMDRAFLTTIISKFDGGPVGIDTLAASVGEQRDTLEDVVEPYLMQQGFLHRTPRGRIITRFACEHLGLPIPRGITAYALGVVADESKGQSSFFDLCEDHMPDDQEDQ